MGKLTKDQVGYENPAKKADHCDDCRHYQDKSCAQVEGSIAPGAWCTIFNANNPFHILGPAAENCCEAAEEQKEK